MTGSALEDRSGVKPNVLPRVEAAIEALLALADELHGDSDLEPEERVTNTTGREPEEDASAENTGFDEEEDHA